MLAGLQLGQQLLDGLLHLGEFRNERVAVHYREISRFDRVASRFSPCPSMLNVVCFVCECFLCDSRTPHLFASHWVRHKGTTAYCRPC